MSVAVLYLEGKLIVGVIPVNHENTRQTLFSEYALRDQGRPRVLEEEDAQGGRAEEPGVARLPVVSPARLVGVLHRVCPVDILQRFHAGSKISSQAAKDIDEASYVDARHLAYPPHGDAVEVVHDGRLRTDAVSVKTPGKDGGPRVELLPAVRAYPVVEAVQYALRLHGGVIDDRPVRFPIGNEGGPALGTDLARIFVNDDIGGLFRNGDSAMALVAGDRPSLFLCLLLGGILLEGFLG